VTIIADHPLTGIGLGSYSMVYPFYADKSLRDRTTALHAESDWLTLCCEGGVPALLIAVAALVLLIREITHLKTVGRNWPLRWAFLSAFFAELLHGLVDVPLHKPELGWWVLLLGGIGFGNTAALEVTHGISFRIQRILFILGGLVMICSGSLLLIAQSGRGPVIPPFATLEIQKRVLKTFGDGTDPGGVKGAVEELGKAIALHPMAHQLYYQLAVLIMAMEDRVEHGKALFSVQQALSPIDPDLLFEQGKTLMRLDPDGTAVCWNEALRRQLVLDHSPNSPIARTAELYGSMIREAQGQRELFYKLQDLASVDPELRIMWLGNPAAEKDSVGKAINDRAFVESLSMKQKGRLFELWWRSGDRAAVSSYLDAHPEDADTAIATRAAALESLGKGEQASRMLTDKFGIQVPTPVVGMPSRGQDENAPEDPLAAAKYYMDLGNDITAKRYLTQVLKMVDRDQRNEGLLLFAQIEMRAGNWSVAFRTLLDYLHATGRL
jgi:tetratricopeptide (TPR) repeat protein